MPLIRPTGLIASISRYLEPIIQGLLALLLVPLFFSLPLDLVFFDFPELAGLPTRDAIVGLMLMAAIRAHSGRLMHAKAFWTLANGKILSGL